MVPGQEPLGKRRFQLESPETLAIGTVPRTETCGPRDLNPLGRGEVGQSLGARGGAPANFGCMALSPATRLQFSANLAQTLPAWDLQACKYSHVGGGCIRPVT